MAARSAAALPASVRAARSRRPLHFSFVPPDGMSRSPNRDCTRCTGVVCRSHRPTASSPGSAIRVNVARAALSSSPTSLMRRLPGTCCRTILSPPHVSLPFSCSVSCAPFRASSAAEQRRVAESGNWAPRLGLPGRRPRPGPAARRLPPAFIRSAPRSGHVRSHSPEVWLGPRCGSALGRNPFVGGRPVLVRLASPPPSPHPPAPYLLPVALPLRASPSPRLPLTPMHHRPPPHQRTATPAAPPTPHHPCHRALAIAPMHRAATPPQPNRPLPPAARRLLRLPRLPFIGRPVVAPPRPPCRAQPFRTHRLRAERCGCIGGAAPVPRNAYLRGSRSAHQPGQGRHAASPVLLRPTGPRARSSSQATAHHLLCALLRPGLGHRHSPYSQTP